MIVKAVKPIVLPLHTTPILIKLQVPILIDPPFTHKEQLENCNYTPIKALSLTSVTWKIKARVSTKDDVTVTSNGDRLMKIELLDMYGT